MIIIEIDGRIQKSDVEVSIDQHPTAFELTTNQIKIDLPLDFGLHQLSVKSLTDQRWQILDVKINDASLRKLLYLSWSSTSSNPHIQPSQVFWEAGVMWTLPFGCPVSQWITVVESKILNGDYGKNLNEKYHIWYPERIKIQGAFPQAVKDFFWHNFDFIAIDKTQTEFKKIPYMRYKHPISNELKVLAAKNLDQQFDTIKKEIPPTVSWLDNLKEYDFYTEDQEWKNIPLLKEDGTRLYTDLLPHVWKLLDSLTVPVSYALLGVLPPGGFLYPHIDTDNSGYGYDPTDLGCKLLHIPIQWPDGNWLKMAGCNALSLAETGAVVINNNYYTHAVVNTSDQYRYTLIVRAELAITDCVIK